MRYTLRQLEVFLATAHYENISKAAASLNMSQSAASSALKDLERQFSVELFERRAKRLHLSDLGHYLRPQAEALLGQAQDFEATLLQHRGVSHLKVGATLTIGNYLAVTMMARFMELHPSVKVDLDVANTQQVARAVSEFSVDVGLIEGELFDPTLEVLPWRKDELVVFCAPEHPLAKRQQLTDADLLAHPWILREPGSGTRQHFDRAMHGILSQLTIRLELQHTEAIKRAVEAQLGIGCLSRITLETAFKRGNLVPLAVEGRELQRQLYFVLHREKYRNQAINEWLALCRAMV